MKKSGGKNKVSQAAKLLSSAKGKSTIPPKLPMDSLAYALRQAGIVVQAVQQGSNAKIALLKLQQQNPHWSTSVRGAVRDLSWNCLRDYGYGHHILRFFLHKPLPLEAQALMLVALSRLARQPTQAFKIVDQAIQAIASFSPALKGVCNALLRNTLRQSEEVYQSQLKEVCAHWCHPSWWVSRLKTAYPNHWQQILEAGNTRPPMTLRVNLRRASMDQAQKLLEAAGIGYRQLANEALLLERPLALDHLPGFSAGLLSVQDAGAQWAAHYLDVVDGHRVLDACAAPGGKTAHLLERAQVRMLSLELDATRRQQMLLNLQRLGLEAETKQANASEPKKWWDGKPFDRILADVPCSASGVVRRNPDIKWLRRESDIMGFVRQQKQILEGLWPTLKGGGKMLYVTCSVFPEENEEQIQQFCLHRHDACRLSLQGQTARQLLPDAESDGFYYALIGKQP